jgi:hypothetical protein
LLVCCPHWDRQEGPWTDLEILSLVYDLTASEFYDAHGERRSVMEADAVIRDPDITLPKDLRMTSLIIARWKGPDLQKSRMTARRW